MPPAASKSPELLRSAACGVNPEKHFGLCRLGARFRRARANASTDSRDFDDLVSSAEQADNTDRIQRAMDGAAGKSANQPG
jgi:hypothetical protein